VAVVKKAGIGRSLKVMRLIVTVQVAVCVLAVLGTTLASVYFSREAVAMRSLKTMAKDYYENYFYDRYIAKRMMGDGVLDRYVSAGIPSVNLRQLLSFDSARHGEKTGDFRGCDTEKTRARLKPVKPFGRKDYELVVELECKGNNGG